LNYQIQKWEISAGDGQLSRSWSDRIEPKVKEIAQNFKKFFSRQILKSLFEGCEIWIEDDGLIWVAECIVMNGLEKWKEVLTFDQRIYISNNKYLLSSYLKVVLTIVIIPLIIIFKSCIINHRHFYFYDD